MERWRKEDREEMQKEATIEEKIRIRGMNEHSINTPPAEKRKAGRVEEQPAKRIRRSYDIKRYITCKKWSEEEKEKGTSKTPQGGSRLDTTPVVGGGEKEKEANIQLQGREQTGHYPCSLDR